MYPQLKQTLRRSHPFAVTCAVATGAGVTAVTGVGTPSMRVSGPAARAATAMVEAVPRHGVWASEETLHAAGDDIRVLFQPRSLAGARGAAVAIFEQRITGRAAVQRAIEIRNVVAVDTRRAGTETAAAPVQL